MAMPYFFYETELKEMFVYMNFNHIYTFSIVRYFWGIKAKRLCAASQRVL